MKIRPLHDRLIVKRLEEERKTAGGIVIPDTAAEKPSQGQVVYAGPGKTDDAGMLELLAPYAGHRYRVTRLMELGGSGPPRRGPRMSVRDYRSF